MCGRGLRESNEALFSGWSDPHPCGRSCGRHWPAEQRAHDVGFYRLRCAGVQADFGVDGWPGRPNADVVESKFTPQIIKFAPALGATSGLQLVLGYCGPLPCFTVATLRNHATRRPG